MDGLIIDNFAGGGGASTGIEKALNRPIDIAINHDKNAIIMHKANHPDTKHYEQSIYSVDPLEVVQKGGPGGRNAGKQIELAWFSPDCKHFSKASGGKPKNKNIRDLAWVVIHWVERLKPHQLHPKVIMLENVEEFKTWGPLLDDGTPCKERKGETFQKWTKKLKSLGYKVEFKTLRASEYGTPTVRKRLFMIARCDGNPIIWPEATHGPGKIPFRSAASIIDWSIDCPSIFTRKRPLKENTMRRIANGLMRYVINAENPFIIPITHTKSNIKPRDLNNPLATITTAKGGEFALAVPHIIRYQKGYDGRNIENSLDTILTREKLGLVTAFMAQHNGGPRNKNIAGHKANNPLSTITGRGTQQQIVTSNLIKLQKNQNGKSVNDPLDTILASGLHHAEVRALLVKYYENEIDKNDKSSIHNKNKSKLITLTINNEDYVIIDIGMRMLSAKELFAAQGFPEDYKIDPTVNGKPMTKVAQIAKCGNAVCPQIPEALIKANLPNLCDPIKNIIKEAA